MTHRGRARVALATCAQMPALDADSQTLLDPLARCGVDATAAVWDDPAIDWSRFDMTVVRSCWDYHKKRDAFAAWAAAAGELANPAEVLAWNTDKRYLAQLHADGFPVVPTTWLEPGVSVPSLPRRGRWVVKPAVSLAGLDTGVYDAGGRDERARLHSHVRRLLGGGRVVMLQPFQDVILDEGETSLVFIQGRLSHAVRRSCVLTGPDDGADHRFTPPPALKISQVAPTNEQVSLASLVFDAVPLAADLLYARVDLVPEPGGRPMLMELELIEPQLFLAHAGGAADRMAQAIADRAAVAHRVRTYRLHDSR